MKTLFFSLLLFSSQLLAQTNTDRYIELGGWSDGVGNVQLRWVSYPTDQSGKIDTLIDHAKIDNLVKSKGRRESKINVINELAKDGWVLVSTVLVPTSTSSGGTLYYYLRKTFTKNIKD